MATSQLNLYNGALLACGEERLSSLTEAREARFCLDEVWADGAVLYALQQGLWKFATKTISIANEPAITPAFGYGYGFQIPDDYVRLVGLSANEFFNPPLNDYDDNAGFWFANFPTLFVAYVSNDPSYGFNFGLWTPAFTEWVKLYLGVKISPRVVADDDKIDRLEKREANALMNAKTKDAFEQATKFLPTGSWVRARMAGNLTRRSNSGGLY